MLVTSNNNNNNINQVEETSLSNLPDEIISKIFEEVNMKDLLEIQLVNKRFKLIVDGLISIKIVSNIVLNLNSNKKKQKEALEAIEIKQIKKIKNSIFFKLDKPITCIDNSDLSFFYYYLIDGKEGCAFFDLLDEKYSTKLKREITKFENIEKYQKEVIRTSDLIILFNSFKILKNKEENRSLEMLGNIYILNKVKDYINNNEFDRAIIFINENKHINSSLAQRFIMERFIEKKAFGKLVEFCESNYWLHISDAVLKTLESGDIMNAIELDCKYIDRGNLETSYTIIDKILSENKTEHVLNYCKKKDDFILYLYLIDKSIELSNNELFHDSISETTKCSDVCYYNLICKLTKFSSDDLNIPFDLAFQIAQSSITNNSHTGYINQMRLVQFIEENILPFSSHSAIELIEQLSSQAKWEGLSLIAKNYIEKGDLENANPLIDDINHPSYHNDLVISCIEMLLEHNHFEDAEEYLSCFNNIYKKEEWENIINAKKEEYFSNSSNSFCQIM